MPNISSIADLLLLVLSWNDISITLSLSKKTAFNSICSKINALSRYDISFQSEIFPITIANIPKTTIMISTFVFFLICDIYVNSFFNDLRKFECILTRSSICSNVISVPCTGLSLKNFLTSFS